MRVVAAFVGALLVSALAAAQSRATPGWTSPGTGTAAIAGRVMTADTQQPLPRATVSLTRRGEHRTIVTGSRGEFEFTNLPAGRFAISAFAAGYLTAVNQPDGRTAEPIVLRRGERRASVDVRLQKAAAIDIIVVDADGSPMEGTWVQAQQVERADGRSRLQLYTGQRNLNTDDRGRIRLHGLQPGRYLVSATPRPQGVETARRSRLASLPTFHPGVVRTADAVPIRLEAGGEADVRLQIDRTPVAHLSGRIVRPDGSSASPIRVTLEPASSTPFSEPASSSTAPGNEFVLLNVLPGRYRIRHRNLPDSSINEFASMEVTVDANNQSDLVLTAREATRIRGRFVTDAGEPIRERRGFLAGSIAMDGDWDHRFEAGEDGTFVLNGLTGRIIGWNGAPSSSGWYLKAVMRGNEDITDGVLECIPGATEDVRVILTRAHTEIRGTVHDARNRPVRDYIVAIFSAPPSPLRIGSRYLATATSDDDGRFVVTGLPPGRYLAAATEVLEPPFYDQNLRDPAYLERIAERATPITLRPDRRVSMRVRLLEP